MVDIASVSFGIALFLASLLLFLRTYRLSRLPTLAKWWSTLAFFVACFLIGYSLFLHYLISGHELLDLRSLVSQVFLWGSVFVLLCAWLFFATTREKVAMLAVQEDHQRQLRAASDRLEQNVAERTSELALANEQLTREMAERQRLEEQRFEARLQHVQKLESLGVLAGGIAHDFNNILLSIMGNASWLSGRIETNRENRAALDEIKLASQRASDLANQMLAYSGKGQFCLEAVDLVMVVEEIRELVGATISKKAMLQTSSTGPPPIILADATQIRQVVMNLIINGSDALGEKEGTISVTSGTRLIEPGDLEMYYPYESPSAGRYVYLEVADSGCGMDEQTRERVFDPFFTTKTTGRGLGLAATLGIVRGHHGHIKIETEPGAGTVATILFPAAPEAIADADAAPRRPSSARSEGGLVLVCDDEPAVRRLLGRMLEAAGFDVISASDGSECLDVYRAHAGTVGLVVLDLTMPRMGGREALDHLRRLRPDLPVLLTSGYDEKESTAQLSLDASVGFLSKPYDQATLLELVHSIFEAPKPRVGA